MPVRAVCRPHGCRGPAGWELQLITLNDAPFERLTDCRSVLWRLNTYQGDWRVPARRYRDWMTKNFQPTPIDRQHPAWIRQIRACVIMGLARDVLELLPSRFNPPETLLYLPTWRAAGYDRNYPDYDAVLSDFEPFQVRSPWGKHEKQWWLWERAEPVIRFAYINPALRAWREHFVGAMVRLCRRLPIDALHLDQTLCIYNDQNAGLRPLQNPIAPRRPAALRE